MKRATLISWVDILSFVALVLMVATGLLLEFMLPPGSGRVEHGAGSQPITLVWGLTRHQWGDIHFYISIGLLALVSTHLWIHHKWIAAGFRGDTPAGTRVRVGLGMLGLLGLLFAGALVMFGPKDVVTRSSLREPAQTTPTVDPETANQGRGQGGGGRMGRGQR